MTIKQKELLTMLTILMISLIYSSTNIAAVHSDSAGGKIDLFTQKEPFSGKGPNVPSDAFGPEEVVTLYASVTYNSVHLQNLPVTFYVQRPDCTFFSLTANTNANGTATTNFTIPTPQGNAGEDQVFGEWFTLANVLVGNSLLQDSLTFKVDWIVKLLSVRTIDENLTHRSYFGIEGDVGLELALRNVAMTVRTVTIAVTIKDELNVPVSQLQISNYKAQPNEKLIRLYCKLRIPDFTHVGEATVYVSALTAPANESGVAYCPSISAKLTLVPYEPLQIAFHDVAVIEAVPSDTSIEWGKSLSIAVNLWNEGTEVESFDAEIHCGYTFVGAVQVSAVPPYSGASLDFTLSTSLVDAGNHTITVSIPHLPNEADLTDNEFVDGVVQVNPSSPIIIHDIAIVAITVSNDSVYTGESLQINVTVTNNGNMTETFNLGVYYDSHLIGTLREGSLAPSTQHTFVLDWNTSSVNEGFYEISGHVSLEGDSNTLDNTMIYGLVQVKTRPLHPPVHDIAVLRVDLSSPVVHVGNVLRVKIVLKNKGSEAESFNVTICSNSDVLGSFTVHNLEAGAGYTHTFHWSTSGFPKGNYTLSVQAVPVPGEKSIDDNKLEGGTVMLIESSYTPEWFFWALLFLLTLTFILLIAWLHRRRKRKEAEESFYVGWRAWYHRHEPERRTKRIGS